MASFCTGSNNLAKIVYTNSPQFVMELGSCFAATGMRRGLGHYIYMIASVLLMLDISTFPITFPGVVPEIECFDHGHISNALHLVQKGILRLPLHFNFVVNTAGGAKCRALLRFEKRRNFSINLRKFRFFCRYFLTRSEALVLCFLFSKSLVIVMHSPISA